jgi:ABC-type antimicrobial peptide transport system permease subunit
VGESVSSAQAATPWRTAKPRTLWGDAARTFAKNKASMVGLVVVCVVLLTAIFAPWLAPYDYAQQDWDVTSLAV